jgi:hypothetical protein
MKDYRMPDPEDEEGTTQEGELPKPPTTPPPTE